MYIFFQMWNFLLIIYIDQHLKLSGFFSLEPVMDLKAVLRS